MTQSNSEKAALMVSQLINLYESGNMPEYFEFRSLMIQTLESGLNSYEVISGEIDNLCVEI